LKHSTYESREFEIDPENETPEIIGEINKYLKAEIPDEEGTTIEAIAEKVSLSKDTLYELTKNNRELSEAFGRLKKSRD
jgi:hypothetical protein